MWPAYLGIAILLFSIERYLTVKWVGEARLDELKRIFDTPRPTGEIHKQENE